MAKKETALSTTQEAPLTLQELNSEFGDLSGLVQVRREILKTPRLKLVQKMTKGITGLAVEGDFFCALNGTNYGKSVTIIPLFVKESAALMAEDSDIPICYSPDLIKNKDGILCQKCPHNCYWNDWGTPENKIVPECKTSIDVICLVGENKECMVMSFRKTSHPAGRALINFIANNKIPVPFSASYTLVSKPDSAKGKDFVKVSDTIERHQLTESQIREIIPIAKRIKELEKAGALQMDAALEEESSPQVSESDDIPL